MPPQPPISISQAARESGIPKRTIQWAIINGHIKADKFPGKTGAWLVNRASFQKWAKKQVAA